MMLSLRSRFRAATKSLMADHSSSQSSPPTQKKKNNNNNNCTKPVPSSSFIGSPRFKAFSSFNKCFPDSDPVMSPTSILEAAKPFSPLKNPFWCDPRKPKSPKLPLDSKGIGVVLSGGTRMVVFGTNVRVKIPSLLESRCDFGTKSQSSSLPNAVPTGAAVMADHLCPGEMELSEDYTCVVYHGPNPKTTHIYGNCIVDDFCSWSSPPMDNEPPLTPSPKSFLSCCYTCRKDLGQDNDIYIYRGEKAFCSRECRYQEMILDDEEEG